MTQKTSLQTLKKNGLATVCIKKDKHAHNVSRPVNNENTAVYIAINIWWCYKKWEQAL